MNNKKKKIKRKMFFASSYEIRAIENFLEEEAEKGWMFERCSGMFYVFEECEPVKLKFQVDYFDKATIFDTNPESNTLDYIEYCSESGWQHVFSSGKMQIFYSVQDNPVPIQTDEKMKLKLVCKATILANWVNWILLPLIWGLFNVREMVDELLNPNYYFAYSRSLTELSEVGFVVFWLAFTLLSIVNMARFGIFYFRNKRRLKNGLGIQYYSSKNIKKYGVFHQIYLISLLVLLAALFTKDHVSLYLMIEFIVTILMIFLISKMTYSKWANRKANIVIMLVFPIVVANALIFAFMGSISRGDAKLISGDAIYVYSTDDIDLTLEDLGVDKPDEFLYEETVHDKAKSFLGMREVYSDYYNTEDNSYGYSIEIFSSKYKSIMDTYNQLVLEDEYYTYTGLTATKNTWCSDQVLYGTGEDVSMYVVVQDGITFVIEGHLNQEQAAEVSSYYMNMASALTR